MAGLKLVSVNIERSKHLDRVIPFLLNEKPDVVCIQELNEIDVERIQTSLHMDSSFIALGVNPKEPHHPDPAGVMGVGIFASDIRSSRSLFYRGNPEAARVTVHRLLQNLALHSCEIVHGSDVYRIITTHFTWTPDGLASDAQRSDLEEMLALLKSQQDFVLCGDFNAPRGGEIFSKIASMYTDNIPQSYTSSIDGNLHRAGPLPLMVDGLFTTPRYEAHDVHLQDGVSDHCAIVATIEKR